MADLIGNPNIAAGVTPQGQMSLGDMVNLARGVQAYQQAQQVNPLLVQEAQQRVAQQQMSTQKQQSELGAYYRDITRKTYGGLLTDPDFNPNQPNPEAMINKLNEAKDYLVDVVGVPTHESKMHDKLVEHLRKNGPEGAKRVIQTIANGVQQAQTTAEQGAQLNKAPNYISTGPAVVPVYTSPYQLGGKNLAPTVELGIGPGQRMEATGRVDPTGAPTAYVRDVNGNIMGEVTIPAGVGQQRIPATGMPQGGQPAPQAAPQSNAPVRMPFETSETVSAARNIQLKANEAAKGVQNSLFNNNKIIQLADKALVGAGAETLSKLGGGYAALPWTSDATQNRQILGHQMALETANLASAAGLGTDAARGIAEKMAGTTEWTPDAIKATARMNRALSTGIGLFNEGANNSVKAAGNNPLAAREFQNRWTSQENLVPTLQFVDAVRNSDQAAIKQIVDGVGGYGSNGYKQLLIQADNLSKLVKGK